MHFYVNYQGAFSLIKAQAATFVSYQLTNFCDLNYFTQVLSTFQTRYLNVLY